MHSQNQNKNEAVQSLDPNWKATVFKIRCVDSRWITLMRHIRLGAGMEPILTERGAKGEKQGAAEEGVLRKLWKKWATGWRLEGREGTSSAACQKLAWWDWASEQMLIWRWCSLQHSQEHSSFLLKWVSEPKRLEKHAITSQPTENRTISTGRVKWESCSRVPCTSVVLAEWSDQSSGRL